MSIREIVCKSSIAIQTGLFLFFVFSSSAQLQAQELVAEEQLVEQTLAESCPTDALGEMPRSEFYFWCAMNILRLAMEGTPHLADDLSETFSALEEALQSTEEIE